MDDSKRPRRTLLQQLFVKILFNRLADYSEKEAAIVGTAKVIRDPIIGGRVSESSISIVQRTVVVCLSIRGPIIGRVSPGTSPASPCFALLRPASPCFTLVYPRVQSQGILNCGTRSSVIENAPHPCCSS